MDGVMRKGIDNFDPYLTRRFAGDDVFEMVDWLDDLNVGDWSVVSFRVHDDAEQAFVFMYNESVQSCVLAECKVRVIQELNGLEFFDENEVHYVHSLSLEGDTDLRQLIVDALCEIHNRELEYDG
jgi:hypothetical protein